MDENQNQIIKELQNYLSTENIQLKGPESADKVYKDECVYCFDTPFDKDGLFISLSDYVGVCAKHINKYIEKTSTRIFLNITKFKLPKEDDEEPKDKIQRLCIKETQDKIGSEYTLRFHPHLDVPIQISEAIGDKLREICDLIVAHVSAEIQQRLQSGISEWDGEERLVSKAAEGLVQLEYAGPPIPYEGWVCSVPDCLLEENLWLNLSDGVICCGRFAINGQKGNGHAKRHYEETGFPLVVKLGTIENEDGDIYSYSEDDSVKDPFLKEHLAHFNLDIEKFRKTERTTLELELDSNMKHEFSAIQEEGATLQNVYGPDFTGLINLGSSCYINSVLQLLYNVPDVMEIYGKNAEKLLTEPEPVRTYEDFNCQFAKVIGAMHSGHYSKEGAKENGIRPTIFRRLVGRGHFEFSTAKQQDAEEYIRHLFEKIDQNIGGRENPVDAFRFLLINRFEDEQSHRVRYNSREDTILSLPVPHEKCRKSSIEINGVPRKLIGLEQCLSEAFSEEYIEGYVSPVLGTIGRAKQEQRLGSFPDFLIIQIKRFEATESYEVKKLDVDVEISEELDLGAFYSSGELQPGEEPLPEDTTPPKSMNAEQEEKVVQLADFGFTPHQSKFALERFNWDMNGAVDWLLSHPDEVPPEPAETNSSSEAITTAVAPKKAVRSGPGKYRLRGFISHMGSSPHTGHYVAHVKRDDGNWYIFNDEKVALSQNPPKSLGYLYFYERDDGK